jgi:DNA-binding LacI/PurR family transcriptional regulator
MGIREVAKRASVSIATVSRTINKAASVDPGTAARVWKAIEELRYFPDQQARALVSGRSRILGLIVQDITNPFFPELVKGFEDVAMHHGYEIMISSTNSSPVRTAHCVQRLLERKVEGIAIMTGEVESKLADLLSRHRVPAVFLDVGPVREQTSKIRVEYTSGIGQAVEHLLGLGHRRIGFISGPIGLKSAEQRLAGFNEGIAGDPGAAGTVAQGDHSIDGGLEAMTRLLESGCALTAVVTSNDLTAIGALRAIHRKGLNVPRDISVVGFDDIHFAEFTEPPLTTVRLSRRDLAETAIRALLQHIDPPGNGVPAYGHEYAVTPALVVRESTAPPRR